VLACMYVYSHAYMHSMCRCWTRARCWEGRYASKRSRSFWRNTLQRARQTMIAGARFVWYAFVWPCVLHLYVCTCSLLYDHNAWACHTEIPTIIDPVALGSIIVGISVPKICLMLQVWLACVWLRLPSMCAMCACMNCRFFVQAYGVHTCHVSFDCCMCMLVCVCLHTFADTYIHVCMYTNT